MHSYVTLPQERSTVLIDDNDKTAFSLLRIFAAFSVIIIHVADPTLPAFSVFGSFDWWVGHIYHVVFRSGIPIFLMLTGALILPKAKGFEFVKNRLLRIGLPFIFWTFIFLVAKHKINDLTISHFIYDLINGNNYSYHFWYIYFIALVYTIMPLLKVIIDKLQPNTNIVFVSLIILTSATYFVPNNIKVYTSLHNQIIYVGYVVFGYCLLYSKTEKWTNNGILAVVMITIGLLITGYGTYLQKIDTLTPFGSLYDNTKLHMFLKIFGTWILIRKYAYMVKNKLSDYLRLVSNMCFGIYLIHPLVLEHIVIVRMGISINTYHTIVGVGLTSVLCFIIGAIIIFVLSKLPFGKYTY